MYEELKKIAWRANIELARQFLAIYTRGNVSGIDRCAGVVAIKPSGVAYEQLTPDKMVVLDLSGKIIEGKLNPSSDTPTHLELYRNFKEVGGICHTHSTYATMWTQPCRF
jgi:L-ribulose-5-phosphate 4-epimerase